jgi:hypothetical protein
MTWYMKIDHALDSGLRYQRVVFWPWLAGTLTGVLVLLSREAAVVWRSPCTSNTSMHGLSPWLRPCGAQSSSTESMA